MQPTSIQSGQRELDAGYNEIHVRYLAAMSEQYVAQRPGGGRLSSPDGRGALVGCTLARLAVIPAVGSHALDPGAQETLLLRQVRVRVLVRVVLAR